MIPLALSRCWRKYIQPCKSVIFVSGLAVTHKYINYAVVDVLITFFTDHKEPIVHAAALTNLGEGLSGITLVFMTATSTFHASHLRVILCSTLAYVVGLLMLCLNAYHVNVFNMIPAALYYSNMVVVVIFIYVGKTGSKPILDNFFKGELWFHSKLKLEEKEEDKKMKAQSEPEQDEHNKEVRVKAESNSKPEDTYKRLRTQFHVWRVVAWLVALVPILLTSDFDWPLLLVVSSSMLAASCVWFWLGALVYHPIPSMINPLSVVIRVLWAAFSNRKAPYPKNHTHFFKGSSFSASDNDKWVDKAAIKVAALAPDEQEIKCRTVIRVQETKYVLKMFPIWVCFLGFSVARATWKTFFVEQADNISDGRDISVTTLLIINTIAQESISYLWEFVSGRLTSNKIKEYIFLKIRICLGMLLSSICLVVAWQVDSKKPETTWVLVVQFCLSGFAEGLALNGLALFYNYRVPESMRGYGDISNEVVNGTGHLLSIVWLYVLRSTCFVGEDIGSVHLYKYYIITAIFSFISFLAGSLVMLARYAYISGLAETGYLDSGDFFMNDASEQEKRLHAQGIQAMGGDPDTYKDAVLQDSEP